MTVTVYSKPACVQCTATYRALDRIGVPYEIVDISEKIGTYETSVLPYEDCCTIFVAKHPVTKPNLNVIKCSERHLDDVIDEMMERAVSTAETIEVC